MEMETKKPIWLPLDSAPRDGTEVWVLVAPRDSLNGFECECAYHPDAGWCADEIRPVMYWRPLDKRRPLMSAIDHASKTLTLHEDYRQFPYIDTKGLVTIGYGLNLDQVGITEEEARWLLIRRIATVHRELEWAFPWYNKLDDVRQAALIDMGYNLGLAKVGKFVLMLLAFSVGDYDAAAYEASDSKWRREDVSTDRSNRIITMIRTGEPPFGRMNLEDARNLQASHTQYHKEGEDGEDGGDEDWPDGFNESC